MNTDYEMIEKFMQNIKDDKIIDEILESNTIIWIDWREYDEDIVKYFADKIDNQLTFEMRDNGKKYGDDIILYFNENRIQIPYDDKMTRDLTITTINEIIKSDYEIRWCMETLGSDTLGFVILKNEDWKKLQEDLEEKLLNHYFEKLMIGKKMFELDIDEVFKMIDERKKMADKI